MLRTLPLIAALLFAPSLFGGENKILPSENLISSLGKIGPDYRTKPYLDQAIALQELGPEKAISLLQTWSRDGRYENQVILLCRMLFAAKDGREFRRPGIGGAIFIGQTNYVDWPLEPITVHQGIPILIAFGYFLGGVAESSQRYLDYCIKECKWNDRRFEALTEKEMGERLENFVTVHPWKKPLPIRDAEWLKEQGK